MYHGQIYPNYLSGTGYIMSRDVVTRLYQTALETPLIHIEDVYITGIIYILFYLIIILLKYRQNCFTLFNTLAAVRNVDVTGPHTSYK